MTTRVAVVLGIFDLGFCVGGLAIGRFLLHLDTAALQTLTVVILVFSGQAVFYVSRERRHLWRSLPGRWLIVSSIVDIGTFGGLAIGGILMKPLPAEIVAGVFVVLALVLDTIKVPLFRRFAVA